MVNEKKQLLIGEAKRLIDETKFTPEEYWAMITVAITILDSFRNLSEASQTKILKMLYDYQLIKERIIK